MKATTECIPCYLKQAHSAITAIISDEAKVDRLMKRIVPYLSETNLQLTPAENSTVILKEVNKLLNTDDPFYRQKCQCNRVALQWEGELHSYMERSPDRLKTAIKLSVVGNVIDLGIKEKVDIKASFEAIFAEGFVLDDSDHLIDLVQGGKKKVLFIGDNAGEIVFDKVLVRELLRCENEVVYVVKGGPILNDALMEDVREVGMDRLCRVIDTGSNWVGVVEQHSSPEFMKAYHEADIIVSKGQGNYETLTEMDREVFHILKAKCDVVARALGVRRGEMVCKLI
ncbi:MAG: ARMT1-like domain-containing protein [Candidatus Aminicenantes bacterium]|nr:ARMT1-like domain-containing protein [Candidatus Aminicenantes bacterium]